MGASAKNVKLSKFGLSNSHKKTGINLWRFFMSASHSKTGAVHKFFIEFEILNPALSADDVSLGFAPRVNVTSEDLQYVLAGTKAAQELQPEKLVQPAYVAVRIGMAGSRTKQLCSYVPFGNVRFSSKPFEIQVGNKYFSEDRLSGFLDVPAEELEKHPEYLCDSGYASWELSYEIVRDCATGFRSKEQCWLPFGFQTEFSGKINFDGAEYFVESKKSKGYMDRFWGATLPDTWFQISSGDMTSLISGRQLFDSAVAIQGIFDGRVSLIMNVADDVITFFADSDRRAYTTVWNCVQPPETEEGELLHWSVSINNKLWVVDVDIYCKVADLANRSLELPEGKRRVLNLLFGGNGYGEIKLFKKIRNVLEQIEYIKIENAVCEFGHHETTEI